MPLYEYLCEECSHNFEELIYNASQETSLSCPRCGSRKVKKKMSLFGFSARGGNGDSSFVSSSGSSCAGCSASNCSACSTK